MKKARDILLSDVGMSAVNLLFLLSLLIRGSGIVFVFYLAWIAYLVVGARHTQHKSVKVINAVLILFASVMVILNVCLFLNRV